MIHENEDDEYDFSWFYFVGHTLLGYSDKEIGRMTIYKFFKLYGQYKINYDFKLSKITYHELEEKRNHEGEFLPD